MFYPADPGLIPYWERIQNNIALAPNNKTSKIIDGLNNGVIRRYSNHSPTHYNQIKHYIKNDFKDVFNAHPDNWTKNVLHMYGNLGDGTSIVLKSLSGIPFGTNANNGLYFGNLVKPSSFKYENLIQYNPNDPLALLKAKAHTEFKASEHLFSAHSSNSGGSFTVVTKNLFCSNCERIMDALQIDIQIDMTRIELPNISRFEIEDWISN